MEIAVISHTPPRLSIKGLTSLINPNICALIMIVFGFFGFPTHINGQNESQFAPAKPSAPAYYDTIAGKPVQKSVLLM